MSLTFSPDLETILPHCLKMQGRSLAPGLGIGAAYFHNEAIHHRDSNMNQKERIERALDTLAQRIEDQIKKANNVDLAPLWQMHLAFSKDKGWRSKLMSYINDGLTAEQAATKSLEDVTRNFSLKPFWKARIVDWEAVTRLLLDCMHSLEKEQSTQSFHFERPFILVAENMSPGDLLLYPDTNIAGIVLGEISPFSHLSIIARSLGVPIVSSILSAKDQIKQNQIIILDGYTGTVSVLPEGYDEKWNIRDHTNETVKNATGSEVIKTRDDQILELHLNISFDSELKPLKQANYDGIGLCRTEFLFMMDSDFPSVEKQVHAYKKILEQVAPKPVCFRLIDIGSDKKLHYFQMKPDTNPALGWRSIRLYDENKSIFTDQITALIKAAHGHELKVIIPMVAERTEYQRFRRIIDDIATKLKNDGYVPSSIKFGITVEIPSIILQLPVFANEIDFISLGTNDLHQFYYAADRLDMTLYEKYDRISRSFLILLRRTLRSAREINVPVNVCGEMVNYPEEALCLLGLGFKSVSVSPVGFYKVKDLIPKLDLEDLQTQMVKWLDSYEDSVRPFVTEYMREKLGWSG